MEKLNHTPVDTGYVVLPIEIYNQLYEQAGMLDKLVQDVKEGYGKTLEAVIDPQVVWHAISRILADAPQDLKDKYSLYHSADELYLLGITVGKLKPEPDSSTTEE